MIAVYEYALMMYWKASSIRPPLQPWLPSAPEQSTSCCSDRDNSWPVLMKVIPSTEPVVEKDQQEPQSPWFFTGVTAPAAFQSTEAGRSALDLSNKFRSTLRVRWFLAAQVSDKTMTNIFPYDARYDVTNRREFHTYCAGPRHSEP